MLDLGGTISLEVFRDANELTDVALLDLANVAIHQIIAAHTNPRYEGFDCLDRFFESHRLSKGLEYASCTLSTTLRYQKEELTTLTSTTASVISNAFHDQLREL